MPKEWFVLRVLTGKEDSVKKALEKSVKAKGMESLISQVIVPTEKISEIKGGKKRVTERKIYPGYIMVEMELNDDTWLAVIETPGIGDFLGRNRPTPMAHHEVEKMLLVEKSLSSDEVPQIKINFKKGDSVRIKDGPFDNMDGIVDELNPTKGLVKVIVTIFGRATPVELEYWQIEAG